MEKESVWSRKIETEGEKARLRKKIRAFREKVTVQEKEQWDETLCRLFFRQLEKWQEQERRGPKELSRLCVYLYMDIRNEAGTLPILRELWKRHIRTAVPKVEGKELQFYVVESLDQLASGHMGILEPVDGSPKAEEVSALVLVPGMAFDLLGGRLGYGGGFYDRFFAREPEHPRWALAYGFQMAETVPCASWDKRMDAIITPEEVWEVCRSLSDRQEPSL